MNSINNFLIEQALNHRSIRDFKSEPIPDELFKKMMDCGLRSSSSGNMQSWTVIATREKELKRKLYEAHNEQNMILQVPVVLTFCADQYRTRRWLKIRDAKDSYDDLVGFMVGAVDSVIAAQSIVLAAESEPGTA